MILVDTSVWIDHLHRVEPALVEALYADEVGSHPLVVEELALGGIGERAAVLTLLSRLRPFPVADHDEVLALVDGHRLWGRGLGAVDAHLLASALLRAGSRLWTRDRRMREAGRLLGIALVEA